MGTVATIARFAGRCRCGAAIANGDTVRYDYVAKEIVKCPSCRYVNIGERAPGSDEKKGEKER
jgi:hypothetical protein